MSEFLPNIVFSYLTLMLSVVLLYVVGHVVFSFVRQQPALIQQKFFIKITVGLFTIVSFYAIYSTFFATIYTGVVFVILIYFLLNLNRFSFSIKANILRLETKIFPHVLLALFVISLFYNYLYQFDARLFLHSDVSFYAAIASSLHSYGIETLNTDSFIYGQINADMYHYFNEWLTAFFMNFTQATSLKIFLIIVLPLLTFVIFTGAWTLSGKLISGKSDNYVFYLSFVFLLMPGIMSFIGNLLLNHTIHGSYSILQGGIEILKVKIIVILLLHYFANDAQHFEERNILALALIPIVWPTQIPAFLGGLILWILYRLLSKQGKISLGLIIQFLLPIICVLVYLLLFNLQYENKSLVNSTDLNKYGLLDYLIETYNSPKAIVSYLIGYMLPALILFLIIVRFQKPLLRLISRIRLLSFIAQKVDLLIIFILIAIFVSYGMLSDLFNARQIASNFIYPLLNIILFIVIAGLFQNNIRSGYFWITAIFLSVLFVAVSFRPVKHNDYNRNIIVEIIQSRNTPDYLFAVDVVRENKPLYMYKRKYADILLFNEYFKPVNLNLFPAESFTKPADKLEYYGSVSKQAFYRYVTGNNLKSDINAAKVRFIEEFGFDYLLISKSMYTEKDNYVHQLKIDSMIILKDDVNLIVLANHGKIK